MLKLFLVLLLCFNSVIAETIIIKSPNAKKRSKAILDKNFLFMKADTEEAFTREVSDSTPHTSNRPPVESSSNLGNINSSLNQTRKKNTNIGKPIITTYKPTSTNNKISSQTPQVKTQVNIYDENNWQEYADYEEIEIEESLGVKAIIK